MTARRVKKNLRWKLIKFSFFLCVVIGVFSITWLRTTVVNLGYELSQLKRQKMELVRERKLLSAKKANVYSMEKIENIAIKQLGMSLPKRDRVFFVKKTTGAAPYKVSIKKTVPGDFSSK